MKEEHQTTEEGTNSVVILTICMQLKKYAKYTSVHTQNTSSLQFRNNNIS